MSPLEFQLDKLRQAAVSLLSPGSIFSLPQLVVASAIVVAYLAYRQLCRRGAVRPSVLRRALLSRRILFNRSTYADLFYYLVNTFAVSGLIGWGIFSSFAVSALVVRALRGGFGDPVPSVAPEWSLRAGLTLVSFLGYEIGYYVDHFLKHRISVLWEFHKVHHTADVLTPLTVFRVHPVDTLIFIDIVAAATGLLQGLFIYSIGKSIDIYAIEEVNVLTVAFLFLLAHLQHSQVWMPFRGLAGRIFLSPAHHQIHHSCDPAHYNRNLGSCLAVWDWAFGTLSIPPWRPLRLKFGVAEAGHDPHAIFTLLADPVLKAFAVVRLRRGSGAEVERDPALNPHPAE